MGTAGAIIYFDQPLALAFTSGSREASAGNPMQIGLLGSVMLLPSMASSCLKQLSSVGFSEPLALRLSRLGMIPGE